MTNVQQALYRLIARHGYRVDGLSIYHGHDEYRMNTKSPATGIKVLRLTRKDSGEFDVQPIADTKDPEAAHRAVVADIEKRESERRLSTLDSLTKKARRALGESDA